MGDERGGIVPAVALSPRGQINARLEEAKATLELENSLGVAFKAPEAMVLERLQELEDRVIVAVGTIRSINKKCGLVNVYAPNDVNERGAFSDSLSDILKTLHTPVIPGGDFNMVKNMDERLGVTNDSNAMKRFVDFINCNGMVDLPMSGNCFTWFRAGSIASASKIDRFLLSTDICCWFPLASQKVLNRGLSDHCTVLLKEEHVVVRHKTFKWSNHWADDPDFDKMIKEKFTYIKRRGIGEKLRRIKAAVKCWVADAKAREGDTI
ncbi:hypothetical protein V6N13_148620 [Hibiscus sabdariffa]